MNIDKERMEYVYKNRHISGHMDELIGYLTNIASYHANNKYKLDSRVKEDYIQECVIHAYKKLDKYDPNKESYAFSYFYKAIQTSMLYLLRKDHNKAMRSPHMSSFELIEASFQSSGQDEIFGDEEAKIEFDGKVMYKSDVIQAVKNVKNGFKKYGKEYKPEDEDTAFIFNKLVEEEEKKNHKKELDSLTYL